MDRKEVKKAILDSSERYERVRIRNGEYHAYSTPMQNTNKDGWVFIGYELDVDIKGLPGIGIFPGDTE